jgi:dTDP-4-dehydrorhamnose 3,5-epimerase
MNFINLSIPDVVLIEPNIYSDKRGYFLETYRQDLFEEMIKQQVSFVQDNESRSTKGVVRGLHFQIPPYAQAKLVRVIEGTVLDIAVDLRTDSQNFGEHVSAVLSDENKHQLYIPEGFAHGFATLSETAVFAYKTNNYFSSKHERGIASDDKFLGIDWLIGEEFIQLSERDKNLPSFIEFKSPF